MRCTFRGRSLCCSVFFISHDDQFMIKTMHKEEIKLLLR